MRAFFKPVVVFALVAAGCGATIRTTVAPNANLGQYRTFAFLTTPYEQGQAVSMTDQTIRSTLQQDLAAKGLTMATNGQPDFLVSYHVKTQQQLDVNTVGYGFYGWPGGNVTEYTEGTLIIDFVDAHSKQVFWRGTAQDVVNHPESPDLQRLGTVVGEVVQKYPYSVASAPATNM